ncbi:MAG: GIY-YIG nuclease family protein [Planctomycetaceae bacterium]|nr:GIY-YIG nuclease family protein [Planctomycetaceae bacterium]
MRFWNDDLRFCRRCKNPCELDGEIESECPHCGSKVWFFNYKPIPKPPEIPSPTDDSFWNEKITWIVLSLLMLWGIVAIIQIRDSVIVGSVSALSCIGFGVIAIFKHYESSRFEMQLKHQERVREYAQIQAERIKETIKRYQQLLAMGNERVQYYYDDIYVKAEQALEEARGQRALAQSVEDRIYKISERLVEDHRKWSTQKLRADPENYQRRKTDLQKAFDFVEIVGYDLPIEIRKSSLDKLKESYKQKVYEQKIKEEQREIKREAREEERIRKEHEAARAEAEAKEREIKQRLEEALLHQQDAHSSEIEELRRQLEEAEANSQRAISMAQQTKVGHVYILSNIGSFGENVYKVGMTRRLEPQLRVKELGDASVPFPFDVHAMISCKNAPDLGKKLHHDLTQYRVNRVNLRKEYFSLDLEVILDAVKKYHGKVEYIAEPEALEYRETKEIAPEDLVELEKDLIEMGVVFEDAEDE